MPLSPLWRRMGAILFAAAGLFTLDALVFRTWLYGSILEPDSSTGAFELILRREQFAQARYGPNLILTLGDSRFAYYPRVANQHKAGDFRFATPGWRARTCARGITWCAIWIRRGADIARWWCWTRPSRSSIFSFKLPFRINGA